jgi:DNA-binding NarL/FixJ family response regulator
MNSIIIVEDHPVMRKGLASWFAGTGRWKVFGAAESLDAAKELMSQSQELPDIVLLDIQLKNKQDKEDKPLSETYGLDFIPWLKKQYSKKAPVTAVYTQFDDYVHVNAALSYGVQAYICKSQSETELETALLSTLGGENYIDPAVESKVQKVDEVRKLLTAREAEILSLVKENLSNKRIAEKLNISIRTVENILSCIYYKTGISSRADLEKM